MQSRQMSVPSSLHATPICLRLVCFTCVSLCLSAQRRLSGCFYPDGGAFALALCQSTSRLVLHRQTHEVKSRFFTRAVGQKTKLGVSPFGFHRPALKLPEFVAIRGRGFVYISSFVHSNLCKQPPTLSNRLPCSVSHENGG